MASPSFTVAKPSKAEPKFHEEMPPLEAKPAVAKAAPAVKNGLAASAAEVTHG